MYLIPTESSTISKSHEAFISLEIALDEASPPISAVINYAEIPKKKATALKLIQNDLNIFELLRIHREEVGPKQSAY